MDKVLPYIDASKKLSLREKTGQCFMPAAFINDSEEAVQNLERLIREQHIGGLCFFHSRASAATNFEGAKKIARNENSYDTLCRLIQRYQKAAGYPLLIAIDAEWGLAMRVENTPQYPYAITLGALPDERNDLIFEVGRQIALDCRAAGVHWNLVPCVDINQNPDNPVIGYRSYGADKHRVTEKALAFIKGTQSQGVLTSIKHFPGHGDTATDSHLELPLIDKSKNDLLENELYPFQKLVAEGVDAVMVGHLSVPALANGKTSSSSLSKEIIQGILRDEMGYQGVVISDALNMHAVAKNHPTKGVLEWLAFDAGNDVLCFSEDVPEGVDTIVEKASEEQIESSFRRIWEMKERVLGQWAQQDSGQSLSMDSGHSLFTDSGRTLSAESESSLSEDLEYASSHDSRHPTSPGNQKRTEDLNREIAFESLTLHTGTELGLQEFGKSNFTGISVPSNTENQFFKTIEKYNNFNNFASSEISLQGEENILLSIFPPQVKPTDNFGFSNQEIIFINELLAANNVVVYLFGNPFFLKHIRYEKATAVIIAYQDFKVFQEVAAMHFLGRCKAVGELPVEIKPDL